MAEQTRCEFRHVRKGVLHCMAVELPPYLRRVTEAECGGCRHSRVIRDNEKGKRS